jgi:hypothetical protein
MNAAVILAWRLMQLASTAFQLSHAFARSVTQAMFVKLCLVIRIPVKTVANASLYQTELSSVFVSSVSLENTVERTSTNAGHHLAIRARLVTIYKDLSLVNARRTLTELTAK